MRHTYQVDADGDLNRYLQECMVVHDERIILWSNWVVPQERYRLLSLLLYRREDRSLFWFQ